MVMVAATGVSYWVGEHSEGGALSRIDVCLVFALAFAKGMLVVDVFMGLRHAPVFWRRLLLGWLFAMAVVLASLSLLHR